MQQPLALAQAQDHAVLPVDVVLQAFAGPPCEIGVGAGLTIGQQRGQLFKIRVAQCRRAPAGSVLTQGGQALFGIGLHPARDCVRVDAEPTRHFGAAATLGNQQQAVQALQQTCFHRADMRVAKSLANGVGAAGERMRQATLLAGGVCGALRAVESFYNCFDDAPASAGTQEQATEFLPDGPTRLRI